LGLYLLMHIRTCLSFWEKNWRLLFWCLQVAIGRFEHANVKVAGAFILSSLLEKKLNATMSQNG
jgi:hypothetical protein